MNAEQFVWHVIGLCAQPAWMALCSSVVAKLFWSRPLRRHGVVRLTTTLFTIDLGVALGWLITVRHDGRMAADATMVVATAAYLGWAMRRGA